VSLLDFLEWLGALPPEAWLVPPVVIIVFVFSVTLMLRRAHLNRWQKIADRTGLRLDPKTIVHEPEVVGEYRGRRLAMVTVSNQRARRARSRPWTRVTVDVTNPTFIGLKMRPQDFFDTMLTSVGLQDITIGNERFDRRFLIQSDEPDLAKQLLQDAELQDGLIEARIDSVEMFGSKLEVYYARAEKDATHAELLFNASIRLADGIDRLKRENKPEILE
jgi:hypothetical protein